MATVFINGLAVNLPSRFAEGQVLTPHQAQVLHEIWLKRIVAKLRWLYNKGEIDAQGLCAKALELAALDLAPYSPVEDAEDDDPVLEEAMIIARDLIVGRMAKEGLPPPKGLDIHAKALVDNLPAITERARLRVEARYQAAASLIGNA